MATLRPMHLPGLPYRLTVTRRQAATLFRFFADTDEEAMLRASRLVAVQGASALDAVLTCDGRRVAGYERRFAGRGVPSCMPAKPRPHR